MHIIGSMQFMILQISIPFILKSTHFFFCFFFSKTSREAQKQLKTTDGEAKSAENRLSCSKANREPLIIKQNQSRDTYCEAKPDENCLFEGKVGGQGKQLRE